MTKRDAEQGNSPTSAHARASVLQQVVLQPTAFVDDAPLRQALKSQGGLARLQDVSRGVYPVALNTLKRSARLNWPGGWSGLDKLRRAAITALEDYEQRAKAGNKTTRSGLLVKVSESDAVLGKYRATLFVLLSAVKNAKEDIKNIYQDNNPRSREILGTEAIGRLEATLALNEPPFGADFRGVAKSVKSK